MDRTGMLEILKQFKNKNGVKYGINRLGLFGSVARNEYNQDSDVDVVLETDTPDLFKMVHIKEELESRLRRHVDLVRKRKNMNPYLSSRIEKDAVYV